MELKDFQELVDYGLITNLEFDISKVNTDTVDDFMNDIINKILITQIGMIKFIREWAETKILSGDSVAVQTISDTGDNVNVLSDDPNTPEKEQDPVMTTLGSKTSKKQSKK